MSFKISKSSLVVLAAILVPVVILLAHFVSVSAVEPIYDVSGRLYSSNYEWISLNSDNKQILDFPQSAYKVQVKNDELYGWGWAPYVGWVCFGKTCDPSTICDGTTTQCPATSSCPVDKPNCTIAEAFGEWLPGGWQWKAKLDIASGKITGMAKILSLKDAGLIDFGNRNEYPGTTEKGVQCYDCKKTCEEWTVTSTPFEGATTTPCIKEYDNKFDSCKTCFTRTNFDDVNIPNSATASVVGGSGNICSVCTDCAKVISADTKTFRIRCDNPASTCSTCSLYGSASDSTDGALAGWAWNGNDDVASTTGAGWINFSTLGAPGIVYPWLETQFGSVYGQSNIKQRSSVSGVNATYCIFAQDVYNFSSKNCSTVIKDVGISYLSGGTSNKVYKNALGKIDVAGLTAVHDHTTIGPITYNYNKYGQQIINGAPNFLQPLDNKVYVVNDDDGDGIITFNQNYVIINGASGEKGNGLIIVNGNLTIKKNITYGSNTFSSLGELASVAWVVKGDVIIDSSVDKVAGAFILLGNGAPCLYANGTSCGIAATDEYPRFQQNGHGIFFSGDSNKSLTIVGLIMAKSFGFYRTYSNIKQGSERIIYDGRLIANPPPGLKGLAEGLPVIRDFEF